MSLSSLGWEKRGKFWLPAGMDFGVFSISIALWSPSLAWRRSTIRFSTLGPWLPFSPSGWTEVLKENAVRLSRYFACISWVQDYPQNLSWKSPILSGWLKIMFITINSPFLVLCSRRLFWKPYLPFPPREGEEKSLINKKLKTLRQY